MFKLAAAAADPEGAGSQEAGVALNGTPELRVVTFPLTRCVLLLQHLPHTTPEEGHGCEAARQGSCLIGLSLQGKPDQDTAGFEFQTLALPFYNIQNWVTREQPGVGAEGPLGSDVTTEARFTSSKRMLTQKAVTPARGHSSHDAALAFLGAHTPHHGTRLSSS